MLAYKFHNYKTNDSLRAVQMYFNQSFEGASQKYFTLKVWNDIDGEPGEVIYSQIGTIPFYNGLNEFHNYILDTAKVVPETYYVGWQQTTTDMLNIGFDKSSDVSDKIFYNIYGYWSNTSFSGALMMRPVFSKNALKKGIEEIEIEEEKDIFGIYPNPVNDILFIKLQDESKVADIQITIFDVNGRSIFQSYEFVKEINISKYRNGIYFIKLTNSAKHSDIKKIIISH
ncbi:T9SS type A sorting domain-containing protein, partial [Bacteroidota bacterium]